MNRAALYRLHEGLPRQAPGSDATTRLAIRRLGGLTALKPRVLDVGCGPGRSAIVLVRQMHARVTAIDIHQPYLDQLVLSARHAGVGRLIKPLKMDMAKLKFPPASFDIVWAEGSAYFLGIRQSLETWAPVMTATGLAAFSELCWLTDERPEEAVQYWATAYPAMRTPAEHMQTIAAAGYRYCDHFTMPDKDWWAEYLTPLEARMNALEDDKALRTIIADSRRAIELYRRHGASFGYVFFVVSRA